MTDNLINGKHYPLWEQFVQKKDQFIGGILQDLDGGIEETTITDITLKPNGSDSAFFEVHGTDFGCGFDCQTGGITSGGDGWVTFMGYGGHIWRIKELIKK